jgi:hypothetical protein
MGELPRPGGHSKTWERELVLQFCSVLGECNDDFRYGSLWNVYVHVCVSIYGGVCEYVGRLLLQDLGV